MRRHVFDKVRKLFIVSVSEALLVKKAKHKDQEAYGKLYLFYLDAIYRYIFFRVGQNKQDAEDLAEVVFIKAWNKIGQFDGKNFRAWIYRIAHNEIVDFYRKSKQVVLLDETIIDTKKSLEQEVIDKETKEGIMKAIDKLTEEQKTVIILKFIEGLPNSEIAKVMDKKEEAVRALQYRALKQLQKHLES